MGDFYKDKKKNTISLIAEELGISSSTVYNIINNSAPVSDKLRQSVTECAERHGYDIFSKKGSGSLKKIVAAIPSVPSPFWNNAIAGINDALKHYDLSSADFRFIRYSGLRDPNETLRMLNIIEDMNPDACLFVPCASEEIINKLSVISSTIPTAIIDEPVDIDSVFISVTGKHTNDGIKAAEIISDFPLPEKRVLLIDADGLTKKRVNSFVERCKSIENVEIVHTIAFKGYSKTLASELSKKIEKYVNDFNCVYDPSGFFGSVCLSLSKLGIINSVFVVGHDASSSAREYFENGLKGAIIYQDIYRQAYVATCALLDKVLLNKKNYPAYFDTGYSTEFYL